MVEEVKEKQIELLEKQLAFWKHHSTQLAKSLDEAENTAKRYAELLDKTEDELNKERVKQSECDWISVEDRLPEKEGKYLIYTCHGIISLDDFRSYLLNKEGALSEANFDYYVTHWMYLPEPPKVKGE